MRKLTNSQEEAVWSYLGFVHLPIRPLPDKKPHPTLRYWLYPDGESHDELPKITLDNLFKYALPKLYPYPLNAFDVHFKRTTSYPDHINEINCWFYLKGKQYNGWHGGDSAMAFFLAIHTVVEEKNE